MWNFCETAFFSLVVRVADHLAIMICQNEMSRQMPDSQEEQGTSSSSSLILFIFRNVVKQQDCIPDHHPLSSLKDRQVFQGVPFTLESFFQSSSLQSLSLDSLACHACWSGMHPTPMFDTNDLGVFMLPSFFVHKREVPSSKRALALRSSILK